MLLVAIYAGIFGVLAVLLTLNVIRCRFKYKIGLGDGGHPKLQQAMRAHGNFIETVPLALILIVYVQSVSFNLSNEVLHGLCGGLLIARILHIWGMARGSGTSWQRFIGMVATLAVIATASGMLLYTGISEWEFMP